MRKTLFTIVFLNLCMIAFSQKRTIREYFAMHYPFEAGNIVFGINTTATDLKFRFIEKSTYVSGNLNASLGYFVAKGLSATLKVGTGIVQKDDYSKLDFSLGGGITYYYNYFFINGGYAYKKANLGGDFLNAVLMQDGEYSRFNVGVGYTFFVAPRWAIVPSIDCTYSSRNSVLPDTPKQSLGLELNIGINYYLPARSRRVSYNFPYKNMMPPVTPRFKASSPDVKAAKKAEKSEIPPAKTPKPKK